MRKNNNLTKFITYLLVLFITTVFSQTKGIVIDNTTNRGIPYINIWIENENIGATSNEKGEFILKANETSKIVIFSGIGYETKRLEIKDLTEKVLLKPIVTELEEVEVYTKKGTKELSIDKFKKRKLNSSFATNGTPWMVAKYFPYKKEYEDIPFFKTFKVLTGSRIKNTKFNIRLYTKSEDGKPDEYLYDKNIFATAKKGRKYTEIDVSKLNIQFPKGGFFIVMEWLIIESNKYEYTYTMKGSKKKYKGVSYEPTFGTIPVDNPDNSWIFRKGKWEKVWKNHNKKLKFYKGKYNQIAIELILSN